MSGPVLAADLPVAPVEAPPVTLPLAFDWTGFYVGAQIGYAWAQADSTFNAGFPSLDYDADGVVGGVHVGYNAQFNQIVVGLEGDLEASSVSGDDAAGGGLGSYSEAELNWQGSIRARLGYAFDNVLPYITGGVAFGDWDLSAAAPTVLGTVDSSETLVGWTIGAGVEYAFTQNVTARVEYRYTDYGDENVAIGNGLTNNVDLDSHAVRVGISYKF
jgi:outer membrane immunogenic protein